MRATSSAIESGAMAMLGYHPLSTIPRLIICLPKDQVAALQLHCALARNSKVEAENDFGK
jgi:hypothetical protein